MENGEYIKKFPTFINIFSLLLIADVHHAPTTTWRVTSTEAYILPAPLVQQDIPGSPGPRPDINVISDTKFIVVWLSSRIEPIHCGCTRINDVNKPSTGK